jgi:hypothetical protein
VRHGVHRIAHIITHAKPDTDTDPKSNAVTNPKPDAAPVCR